MVHIQPLPELKTQPRFCPTKNNPGSCHFTQGAKASTTLANGTCYFPEYNVANIPNLNEWDLSTQPRETEEKAWGQPDSAGRCRTTFLQLQYLLVLTQLQNFYCLSLKRILFRSQIGGNVKKLFSHDEAK